MTSQKYWQTTRAGLVAACLTFVRAAKIVVFLAAGELGVR